MTTYERIKALCEKEGFHISNISTVIPGLSVSKASVSGWKDGAKPRSGKLKAIADYFNVSVDYLLNGDDESVNIQTVQDNHGIIGTTHAPVTIINGSERKLSEQAVELLSIFEQLSVIDQANLLVYAAGLLKESK